VLNVDNVRRCGQRLRRKPSELSCDFAGKEFERLKLPFRFEVDYEVLDSSVPEGFYLTPGFFGCSANDVFSSSFHIHTLELRRLVSRD
jgi:hypothetical protein